MERIALKKLVDGITGLTVKGSKEIEITGLCVNSKEAASGNLFVVRRGKNFDGAKYVEEALAAGAVAILSDLYNPFLNVTQLIHEDPAYVEALLADRFYRSPSKHLRLIGITGTSGKTTSTYIIKHILDSAHISCGLMGSIERIVGDNHFPSNLNTPELIVTQKLLSEMVNAGQKAAVMEVSSHGLDQGRVRGIDYSIALFTNFTQDHLDYHQTMEEYKAAKLKLFQSLTEDKVAIINVDDPEANYFQSRAKRFTFGIKNPADLTACEIELTPRSLSFTAKTKDQSARISCALIGRFNVYNLLGGLAVGMQFGLSLEQMAHSLKSLKRVVGRLCPVPTRLPTSVFVDHSHKEDALANVLSTLQELKQGRIITVFGCGGDRDKSKRPKMGRVAEELSDLVVVTSDNPRTEDPDAIAREILQGMKKTPIVELSRRKAIEKALSLAGPQDIVLIAGKGHEKVQIFSNFTQPFDDFIVAQEVANQIADSGDK